MNKVTERGLYSTISKCTVSLALSTTGIIPKNYMTAWDRSIFAQTYIF